MTAPAVAGGSCASLDGADGVAELVGRVLAHEGVAGASAVAATADGGVVLRLDEPGGDVVVSVERVVPIDEATYFELKTPVMWEPWVRLEVDETGLRCDERLPGGA